MTDAAHDQKGGGRPSWSPLGWDRAFVASGVILAAVALFTPGDLETTVESVIRSMTTTSVFILIAITAVAWLKATGAESLLARAFTGSETRMILFAALAGGLSPFCSCQVIPFIAALLAVGAPLSAVMAFWLASPLMDPAMFTITVGTLGLPFALAKTVSAVGLGLLGGATVMALKGNAILADPLRNAPVRSCGCGAPKQPFSGRPHWQFWQEPERRGLFGRVWTENLLFLGKWLLLAYLIEALMIRHVPAEAISGLLGGTGIGPVVLGALIGAPAYLNGYAAVPLIDAMLQQGLAPGAAMSFAIAGGVTSIPAAIAVWALVKPRIFGLYVGIAFSGAIAAGLVWGAIA